MSIQLQRGTKMAAILLPLIYLAYVSMGIPDSMLGSAWPVIYPELGVPVSGAGLISMIIAASTIVSSLFTARLVKQLGNGLLTAFSVLLTGCAMFGFSCAEAYWVLCVLAVPYGLGAGAIDSSLNNYIALHFAPKHMSWCHCIWGIGASIGPYLMGYAIGGDMGWRAGYGIVTGIQMCLTAVLFLSIPVWKKRKPLFQTETKGEDAEITLKHALQSRGMKHMLAAFFLCNGTEYTTSLWASTYLVSCRGASEEAAANAASLFFVGMTLGRFAGGFAAERLGDKHLVRLGAAVLLTGYLMILIPSVTYITGLIGLFLAGVGIAPIYPSIIHETPVYFGIARSKAIIGIQMACAYAGNTLMAPIFGAVTAYTGYGIYPAVLVFCAAAVLYLTERVNHAAEKKLSAAL